MPAFLSAHLPVLRQFVRFGVVGFGSTLVYAIIYWPLAEYVMEPVLAVPIAFLPAVAFGYLLNSRWSFEGHGAETRGRGTPVKFLTVQTLGLLLNALFTWILTGPLVGGPTWWPLVPVVTITPIVTFALNRSWVFG